MTGRHKEKPMSDAETTSQTSGPSISPIFSTPDIPEAVDILPEKLKHAITSEKSNSTSERTPDLVFSTADIIPNLSQQQSETKTTKPHLSPTTHPRFSPGWYKDWSIAFLVFAITGSSSTLLVRPILNNIVGVEGTFMEGPWTFRLCYLVTTLPLYSAILVSVGTVLGKGEYFKAISWRMWGRLIPRSLLPKSWRDGDGRR